MKYKELEDYKYNLKIKKERDRLRDISDKLHSKIWRLANANEEDYLNIVEVTEVFEEMNEVYEQTLILTNILKGK